MTLELFKMRGCPFCNRVLRYMESAGRKDVAILDIHEENNGERLIREGGMDQVPMLLIDGKPLYESQDIIEFLKSYPA